jgi:hypothetical protein
MIATSSYRVATVLARGEFDVLVLEHNSGSGICAAYARQLATLQLLCPVYTTTILIHLL